MEFSEFETAINDLHEVKLPVSASRITKLTDLAIKYTGECKKVVECIEKFIKEAAVDKRLSGLYVIDSIVRKVSKVRDKHGDEYIQLFQNILENLMPYLEQISDEDFERVRKTVSLWKKTGIIDETLIDNIRKTYFPSHKERNAISPLSKHLLEINQVFHDKNNNLSHQELKKQFTELFKKLRVYSNTYPDLNQSIIKSLSKNPTFQKLSSLITESLLNDAETLTTTDENVPTLPDKKLKISSIDAPMVVASAVPFGKKPSPLQSSFAQSYDSISTSRQPLFRRGNPAIKSQNNTWQNYKGAAYTHYPDKDSHPNYSNYSLASLSDTDDDAQGRPIPIFDSERGAEKSSQTQKHLPPDAIKFQNNGDCIPGYIDPYLSKKYFKVLTRTVYVGGINFNITKEMLRDLFENVARVDTVTINYPKFNAFVKFLTRAEAELCKDYFQDFHWKDTVLKMGWGCGYGPKEYFDYNSGETVFPVGRMTDTEKRIISSSSRGGGPIVGGMIVEEPDFGWPQKGEICHGEYSRGQVPHVPGYTLVLAQRKWFKSLGLRVEFSLSKLLSIRDRVPPALLQITGPDAKLEDIDLDAITAYNENSQLADITFNSPENPPSQDCYSLPQNSKISPKNSHSMKNSNPQNFPLQQLAPVHSETEFSDTECNSSEVFNISIMTERRYNDEN